MGRRSETGPERAKSLRRRTVTPKRRGVPEAQGDLALLTRERDEALEQQTAISDILRVISSSPGDVKPVFEAVAKHAARICEAKFADVIPVENGMFSASGGSVGGLGGLAPDEAIPVDRTSVIGRSICDRSPVQLSDGQNAGEEFPLA